MKLQRVKMVFLLAQAITAASMVAAMGDAFFVDETARAGLKDVFVCGEDQQKNYIIEMLGTGVAFLDFDNDGLLDIFAVTASKLGGFAQGAEPVNRL